MKNSVKLKKFLKILLTTLTFALIAFIFYNSIQSAEESAKASGRALVFLNGICSTLGVDFVFTQDIVRTLAHFSEFCLLGVFSTLTMFSYFDFKVRSFVFSLAAVSSTAVIDEIIQLFSDGRAFQVSDMAIDIFGGVVGLILVYVFKKIKGFRRRK